MKVKKVAKKPTVKLTKLGDLKPGCGKVFRFRDTTLADAMSGKDEATFWLVVKSTPEKAGRVRAISVDGTIERELDDFHRVIAHVAHLEIDDAELA
jgi:hypothetical protein